MLADGTAWSESSTAAFARRRGRTERGKGGGPKRMSAIKVRRRWKKRERLPHGLCRKNLELNLGGEHWAAHRCVMGLGEDDAVAVILRNRRIVGEERTGQPSREVARGVERRGVTASRVLTQRARPHAVVMASVSVVSPRHRPEALPAVPHEQSCGGRRKRANTGCRGD